MAQQIKKKFIQNDAVDGQKLKLQKDQSIRGQKQDGSEVELLKLDGSDKLVSGGQELAFKQVVDAQVSDLQGKLDSEEAFRISGDSSLQSSVEAEAATRQQEDQNLSTIIDEEVQSLTDLINEESSNIRSEFAAADASLQSAVDVEKGRIDAILSASEADKDNFAEIVQLINSVDTENDSAFASYVLSNNTALASEVSSRQQGDQDLQSNIDAEESRASDEESRIESKFDGMMASEEASRIAADSTERTRAMDIESSLQSQVTQEVSDRQSADSSLQSSLNSEVSDRQAAISTEQTARIAADADLQAQHDDLDGYAQDVRSDLDDLDGYAQDIRSDLDQEIVDRAAAVSAEASARQSADSTEQAARIAGDASLLEEVDLVMRVSNDRWAVSQSADVAIRSEFAAADASLQSNIDLEQAARIAGDSSTLQSSKDYTDGKISLVMSNLDTEALDSLVEVVTAFQNADSNLNQTISDLSSAATSALAAEQAARTSADETLQSNIDALEGVVQGNFDLQQSDIDGLRTDVDSLTTSLSDEVSARISGDLTIQSNLDAYSLQNDINLNSIHEQMQINDERASLAEEGLQTNIEAEMERSMGVEQSIQAELDATQVGAGLSTDGSYVPNEQASFIDEATSLYEADQMLAQTLVQFQSDFQYSMNLIADSINTEGANRIAADDALSVRIEALEVQTDGPYFQKQKFVIDETSELSSIELSHECMENSLVVCVGRLMVHKDEDYSVSVVGGKSVLTWTGDFATGGSEAIEESDVIFVTFAREV